MTNLVKDWILGASMKAVAHPFPRYILGFALITGCLFSILPLMSFFTGIQVGLVMGSYNYIATSRITK